MPTINAVNTVVPFPVFSAYKSSVSSNVTGNSTFYTVVFDTEYADVGGGYNNSTGVFTAPISGKYLFTARTLSQNCSTASAATIKFVATGGEYNFAGIVRPASSNDFGLSITQMISLAAGETCYVRIAISGEASDRCTVYGGATGNYTTFSGFYISA